MKTLADRNKSLIIASSAMFVVDLLLMISLYYITVNLDVKIFFNSEADIGGPNFSQELLALFVLSVSFVILMFLVMQIGIYLYTYFLKSRAGHLYLKIYGVLGATISFILFTRGHFWTLVFIPFYILGYYVFAREFRLSKGEPQKKIQWPIPRMKKS